MANSSRISPALNENSYSKRRNHLLHIFPPPDNPGVWYPPESFGKFMELRNEAPQLNCKSQEGLFASMDDYERNGWIVNGDRLYESQQAHIEWVSMALCNGAKSPLSFLVLGPAGTGKTKLLGIIIEEFVRLQISNVLRGGIVFTTAKPYHMTAKTVGRNYALRSILQSPPLPLSLQYGKGLLADIKKMFPDHSKLCLSASGWNEILSHREDAVGSIKKYIQKLLAASLQQHGTDFTTQEDADNFIHAAATLVSGRAGTVAGFEDNPKPELLEFDLSEQDGESRESYAGDAAFGIPRDYQVEARGSWNLHRDAQDGEYPKVLLTTINTFTSASGQELIARYRGKIAVILCDEAMRTSRQTFQNPVVEGGAKEPPIVYAASTTHYGRDWERISPAHTLKQSIGNTLPNVRTNLFPSREQEHFPAESEKALEQLVDEHFKRLRLLKKQPHTMDTLMVVHSKLTGRVGRMLRERYATMKINAEIHRYDGKASDSPARDKSQKALLEAWFVRSRADGPNILVTSPGFAKDALDLPNIENLTIGTRVTPDVLYRLIGRALHNNRHRSEGPQYGVYIAQQQFSDSKLGSTAFGVLDHDLSIDEKEGFDWIPGSILMSTLQHKAEAAKTKGKPCIHVPGYRPGDPKSGGIVIADGGTQHVVRASSQSVIPEMKIDFSARRPTALVVENYLRATEQTDVVSYISILAKTAIEAWGRNLDWPQALKGRIAELRDLHTRVLSVEH